MSNDNDEEFDLDDELVSEAYMFNSIVCARCERSLPPSELNIGEATEPFEKWAHKFGAAARAEGWTVSITGSIHCPKCKN